MIDQSCRWWMVYPRVSSLVRNESPSTRQQKKNKNKTRRRSRWARWVRLARSRLGVPGRLGRLRGGAAEGRPLGVERSAALRFVGSVSGRVFREGGRRWANGRPSICREMSSCLISPFAFLSVFGHKRNRLHDWTCVSQSFQGAKKQREASRFASVTKQQLDGLIGRE